MMLTPPILRLFNFMVMTESKADSGTRWVPVLSLHLGIRQGHRCRQRFSSASVGSVGLLKMMTTSSHLQYNTLNNCTILVYIWCYWISTYMYFPHNNSPSLNPRKKKLFLGTRSLKNEIIEFWLAQRLPEISHSCHAREIAVIKSSFGRSSMV